MKKNINALKAISCIMLAAAFSIIFPLRALSQNSGTVQIQFALSRSNNVTTCFAFTNGWDKYIIVQAIFIGPNYSGILPAGGVANVNHYTNLVLSLCNSSNGSNFIGQFYAFNNFHPLDGEAVCGTNDSACMYNTNSSALTITMTNTTDASYRVDVIYKSSTTNGISNIAVNWAYTNL